MLTPVNRINSVYNDNSGNGVVYLPLFTLFTMFVLLILFPLFTLTNYKTFLKQE
jgi:hypothetical protein